MNFNFPDGLAVIFSGYAKRFLEGKYDKLSQNQFFKNLQTTGNKQKYAIEAALYAITAMLDQKMDDNTPIKKFLKEISMDFGPELSKRLMNESNETDNPEEKLFFSILSEIPIDSLRNFLDWFEKITPEERIAISKALRNLSSDEIGILSRIPHEELPRIIDLFISTRKTITKTESGMLEPITSRLENYIIRKKGGKKDG